jgi:hypothetical protein
MAAGKELWWKQRHHQQMVSAAAERPEPEQQSEAARHLEHFGHQLAACPAPDRTRKWQQQWRWQIDADLTPKLAVGLPKVLLWQELPDRPEKAYEDHNC